MAVRTSISSLPVIENSDGPANQSIVWKVGGGSGKRSSDTPIALCFNGVQVSSFSSLPGLLPMAIAMLNRTSGLS